MTKTYRITISGIHHGFTKVQVVTLLATLFKVTEEQIGSRLEAVPFMVKTGIDSQTVEKYREALEQSGCVCAIEMESDPVRSSATSAIQEPAPLQQSSEERGNGIMDCNKCGATNDELSKFCCNCGSELQKETLCTKCGVTLKSELKFCVECGTQTNTKSNIHEPSYPVQSDTHPPGLFKGMSNEKWFFVVLIYLICSVLWYNYVSDVTGSSVNVLRSSGVVFLAVFVPYVIVFSYFSNYKYISCPRWRLRSLYVQVLMPSLLLLIWVAVFNERPRDIRFEIMLTVSTVGVLEAVLLLVIKLFHSVWLKNVRK
jgi:Double zinc ribbon